LYILFADLSISRFCVLRRLAILQMPPKLQSIAVLYLQLTQILTHTHTNTHQCATATATPTATAASTALLTSYVR